MTATRVILAGAGFMGKMHASGHAACPDSEIVAIVDPLEPGHVLAPELGVPCFDSLSEAFAAVDADMVDVCVPTFLHEEYVLTALEAGYPVLCEKPTALSSESARRMADAAARAGRPLMIAQVLRFWPEYVAIREALEEGFIGEHMMASAVRLGQFPAWADWYADPELSGGGALDLHAHDIDELVHLFGRVAKVSAIGWKNDRGAWNHVVSSLTFADGRTAVAEGCIEMTAGYPFTMGLRVVGTQGTLDFRLTAGANLDEMSDDVPPTLWRYAPDAAPAPVDVAPGDGYANEIAYFVQQLRAGEPTSRVPLEESLHVIDVLMAIRRSLETGEAQSL